MSRVFLIEPTKHLDLAPALKYGELVTVFDPKSLQRRAADGSRVFRPSVFNPNEYGRTFLADLERHDFDPDSDYVIVAGGVIGITIAVTAVMLKYGRARLLVFNSTQNEYVDKHIEASEITTCDTNTTTGTVTSSLTPLRDTARR